jgi:hypothetical protein
MSEMIKYATKNVEFLIAPLKLRPCMLLLNSSAELLPPEPVDPAHPLPRICDVLTPEVGRCAGGTNSSYVFKCPADQEGRYAAEGSSYEYNVELNGHRMDETTSQDFNFMIAVTDSSGNMQLSTNGEVHLLFPPADAPLFIDDDDFHPRSGPSRKNIVFMATTSPLSTSPKPPSLAPLHPKHTRRRSWPVLSFTVQG